MPSENSLKAIDLVKVFLFYGTMSLVGLLWILFADFEVILLGTKGVGIAAMIAFIVFALSNECSEKTQWGKELTELFSQFLTPTTVPVIFFLAAASSIGEELLFRGAIQNQFGLIVASILFGLVHFPAKKAMIPWTITAIVMGFVIGWLYEFSGHLLAPIMLHFLINFLNIWAINQKYGLPKTWNN
jgi:uncharacterized protein